MSDINIGSDALLVTTLNDNDRVTITRAATGQQVATITAANLRKSMRGVDYSLLTEQIVPGVKWSDQNGVQRQVYERIFKGTAPNPSASGGEGTRVTLISSGALRAVVLQSSVYVGNGEIPQGSMIDNGNKFGPKFYHYSYVINGKFEIVFLGDGLGGRSFEIRAQYIKNE